MNKKGQLSNFMIVILNTVIFILASPIIGDIISSVSPNLSTPAAFFANLILWFILLMFLMMGLKSLNGMSFGGGARR